MHYGRKILAVSLYVITSFFLINASDGPYVLNLVLGIAAPLLWLSSLIKCFREKVSFLDTCYRSFHRPEDYPHTMTWLSSNMLCGYVVLVVFIYILKIYDAAFLIAITVFISTLGDGLAEPVGYRFGRHKYKVRALFTDKVYERSLEGSACVFISAVSIIIAMYPFIVLPQFTFMLVLMPPIMTAIEAKSPHTWDNPFLHLGGGVITVLGCWLFL